MDGVLGLILVNSLWRARRIIHVRDTDIPNGERAIEAHEKRPASVLITDLFMPERDGFETLKYFRARNPVTTRRASLAVSR